MMNEDKQFDKYGCHGTARRRGDTLSSSSTAGIHTLLNSSLSSLMMDDNSSSVSNYRRPLPREDLCDILNDVEALLDMEDPEDILSSSSGLLSFSCSSLQLPTTMEPTPIAPNNANIVDQVHVTETSWYDDEELLQILSPLLTPKRKLHQQDLLVANDDDDDSSSSLSRPTKKMRTMTHNKSVNGNNNDKNDSSRFRSYQSEQWNDRYQDLITFRNEHGHVLVPHILPSNPPLAQWVKRQRYQYKLLTSGKHSTLTKERVTMLETLGFVWDSHRAAWEERLDELRLFKAKHGHTNVPANFHGNPTLAVWIKCQRRQRRLYEKDVPSNMNQERIQKLDDLGFLWNPRNNAFRRGM